MLHKETRIIKRIRAWLLSHNGNMLNKYLEEKKLGLFSELEGVVAEIGPGTGSNLQYLKPNVYWLGIEPNHFMHRYLNKAMHNYSIDGQIVKGCAKYLPIKGESVDVVISSFVLCSVSEPLLALKEIKRILKPGGQFVFIEHVAAPQGTWYRFLQGAVSPLWQFLGDGCQPDRDIESLIKSAGFTEMNYSNFIPNKFALVTRYYIYGSISN